MNGFIISAVTVVFLGCIHGVTSGVVCPRNTYYDSVTRNCDPCNEICDDKQISGTVELCTEKCPDYKEPTTTSTTTTPCNCDDKHRRRRSSIECEQQCSNTGKDRQQHSESKAYLEQVTVIVVIAVISAACVAVGVVVYRRRHIPDGYTVTGQADANEELEMLDLPGGPPPDEPTAESPEIQGTQEARHQESFRQIDEPVHVQATEEDLRDVYERRVPTEEQNKFPTAYPELPSSATFQYREDL